MCRYILLFVCVSFFSFCEEKHNCNADVKIVKYKSPVTVRAVNPLVTPLTSKPYSMITSAKGSVNYTIAVNGMPENITLKSPEIYPLAEGNQLGFSYIENYNTEQGLALSNISCGLLDKKGNLWFGTSGGGVSRYDGKEFVNFTSTQGLAGNLIKCIAEDRNGNLWFGTNGSGVSKYNGRFFINYTTDDGLANNFVKSITEDQAGNIWFGTNEGVSIYSPYKHDKDKRLFINLTTSDGLINNNIISSLEDQKGNIWLGTSAGVSKYNGRSFINYTQAEGLISNIIMDIAEDKNKHIWFATRGGVSEYSPEKEVKSGETPFTNYSVEHGGLLNDYVGAVYNDTRGDVWFAHGKGLSRYNPDVKLFTNVTQAQGLSSNTVSCIVEDKTGNMWFGTGGSGLDKFYEKPFTSFTYEQGLVFGNIVWCFNEDSLGNLWIGTSSGVGKYNGKCFSNNYYKYLTMNVRAMIKDKSGAIWWGGAYGLCKSEEKLLTVYGSAQGLAVKSILSILEDNKGNLWLGTYGSGVVKFDGKSFTNYTKTQGLANDVVKCITEDLQGNIWFGTNGNGVSKFDGTMFTNYSTEQGLGNNIVLSSMKDRDGNLWFGTFGGGVSKYDGKKFINYTTTQGLANDVVYAIAEDTTHNMLWFGTNLGLSGLKRNDLNNNEIKFENFNSSTGFPVRDINTGALFVDSKGVIWTGSSHIMLRFDYSRIRKNTSPPTVFIQTIKVQNEYVSWYRLQSNNSYRKRKSRKTQQESDLSISTNNSIEEDSLAVVNEEVAAFGRLLTLDQRREMDRKYNDIKFDSISSFYPVPLNLVLPSVHNNITFDFGAIETDRPQLVRYQFFLEGYDKEWSPVTEKKSATYGNIYEGQYTFKVKARSPDGVWSAPVLYTFSVLPPWYRTWWMYVIYSTSLLASIGLFFRWRTASLRKEKQRLEQIVKERTAEVVEQKELVEKKSELVEEKQKEILDSINYAKRIQYALLAHNNLLKENLNEFFVLFQPKDIVSGDFYWATTVTETNTSGKTINRFYLAVCDSTGHGVPGAFMSLLNISFLNEAINEKKIRKPNEILNHVRQRLIENISKEGAQDGMDGILLCYESDNGGCSSLTYAASNNAPVIVRNNTIIYLSADKMPVGKGEQTQSFTLHSIEVEKQDVLYLFTDGYADQFGGPKSKKFKYKQLEDLLIGINKQPMDQQKQVLESAIKNWMGDLEQVDDILIIGLKID